MKEIIPFKKEIIFDKNINEITSISLENTLNINDNNFTTIYNELLTGIIDIDIINDINKVKIQCLNTNEIFEDIHEAANKYNTTIDSIKQLNNLVSDLITIGEELQVKRNTK